jgi:transposase
MQNAFKVAAGIDVHRDTVVVSIRRKKTMTEDQVETRTFETFRDSLLEMSSWLRSNSVEAVGLESTGVYWMPVVRVLQEDQPSLLVWLVNPLDVKRRAGRKTDRKDSQWISELVLYARVAPSYLPSREQEELRKLTRHRTKLVADHARYSNRIIKELESSGVKLASVMTDCLGTTGRSIISALLAKQQPLDEIADLARGKLRKKIPLIRRALDGAFTPSTEAVLRQLLALSDLVDEQIGDVDARIAELMAREASAQALAMTVPGIRETSAAAVLAESGADMSVFASSKHITAWAGLSPGSNESAGKAKAAPARKGNKYLRTALVQSAWSAVRKKQGFWPVTFRKLRARLGPKKAIVAIARKMLVALYYVLRDATPYRDPAVRPSEQQRKRLANRLTEKLRALGYAVSLLPTPPGGVS